MNESTRKLLRKLANGRPKPSKDALQNLFLDIQNSRLEALTEEFCAKPKTTSKPRVASSPLEVYTKSGLRKIRGKAKDFVPYLLHAAVVADPNCQQHLKPSGSLKSQIDRIAGMFGSNAKSIVDEALKKYTNENDVSYRLANS